MVYNEKKVELLRQRYPEGTRICLDHMEDLCPVESGTNGTIIGVDDIGSVMVKWDNGRTLNLLPDEDKFHTIKHEQTQSDEQEAISSTIATSANPQIPFLIFLFLVQ